MRNIAFLFIVLASALSSCFYIGGKRIKGNGNIGTKEVSVGNFKNVSVSGAIDLYVAQGDNKPVKIETDDNLLQYVEVIPQGDKIEIRTREGYSPKPTNAIKVYVTSPLYNRINVSGACNIKGENKINNAEALKLEVTGAGDINMDVHAPEINASISGAGGVNLKGETKTLDLDLTGAGKAHCFDLLSENTKVDISGAGDAEVYASVKLDAQVSGAGSVKYKGGASNITQQVSGAGSVKKQD